MILIKKASEMGCLVCQFELIIITSFTLSRKLNQFNIIMCTNCLDVFELFY